MNIDDQIVSQFGRITPEMLDQAMSNLSTTNVEPTKPFDPMVFRRAVKELERMRAEERARQWRMWHLYGLQVRDWQMPIMNAAM